MTAAKWETIQDGEGLRTERLSVLGGHLYRVACLDFWDREYSFQITFAPAKAPPAAAKKAPRRVKIMRS